VGARVERRGISVMIIRPPSGWCGVVWFGNTQNIRVPPWWLEGFRGLAMCVGFD
jgi:hypothetical protein